MYLQYFAYLQHILSYSQDAREEVLGVSASMEKYINSHNVLMALSAEQPGFLQISMFSHYLVS